VGAEDLRTREEVVSAIARLRAERPSMDQVLVKLNEGVSGEGNALVDLADLPAPGDAGEERAIDWCSGRAEQQWPAGEP
jgi:hypothetical protein